MSLGADILATLTDAERAEFVASLPLPKPATDGWVRGARGIAQYLGGCSPARIRELERRGLMPCVYRDGSGLVAKRADLDAWIERGGARRLPPTNSPRRAKA